MSGIPRLVLAWLLALYVLAPEASAQDTVTVEVRVTTVTGASCYLDKGRSAGLEPGDRVTFFPATGPGSEGTIRAVAKNSARAELDAGSAAVQTGDRGEVIIPRARLAPPEPVAPAQPETQPDAGTPPAPVPQQPAPKVGDGPPAPAPPLHPPWEHPPEQWTQDTPLLAPAFGLSPEERESRVHGRAWLGSQYTRDESGSSRRYLSGNAGFDATMDNPFGKGGSLRFDASLWTRSADADADDVHTDETRLRVNRLTYEVGGTEDDPTRWQFGRFLQRSFPELGVLDGVEWDRRLADGSVVGASVGAMPEPFSTMSTFDDLQAAAWYRHAFDEKQRNTLGLAYQNTWHHGDQDRNLFVADGRFTPAESLRLRTTAWIDFYGPGDVIKDDGFELTELTVSGTWLTTAASGIGLVWSHRRIPELMRDEFQPFDAQSIRDNELDRIALNGWYQLTPRVRLDARADHWSDQDDSGSTVEVGTTLRDLLFEQGDVRVSVFRADGTYSSGPGFRLSASKAFGRTTASLGYDFVDYEQKDFTGGQSKLAQQTLFGSIDFPLSERFDLSILGDRRFGDEQDAWTLGFLLQWRF